MILVYGIFAFVVLSLIACGKKDVNQSLPLFTFYVIALPRNVQIELGLLPNITVHRVALVMIIVMYILTKGREDRRDSKLPLAKPIILNIILTFMSTLLSIDFIVSFKDFLSTGIEFYLLYYILFKSIRDFETIKRISLGIFAALTFSCIIGLIQLYFLWDPISYLPRIAGKGLYALSASGRGVRPRSVFPHSILFGAAMVIGIAYCLHFISESKQILRKMTIGMILCLMVQALFSSISRGPWMGFMILLIIFYFGGQGTIRKYVIAIFLTIFVVLLLRPGLLNYLISIYERTMNPDSTLGASFSYRYALIPLAYEKLTESGVRLLFGYGPETFDLLNIWDDFYGRWHHFRSCDSSWIGFLFAGGVLGFLSMVYLLLSIIIQIGKGAFFWDESGRSTLFVPFTIILVLYFLMTNVAIYGWSQFGYLFWIIVGTSFAVIETLKNNQLKASKLVYTGRNRIYQ